MKLNPIAAALRFVTFHAVPSTFDAASFGQGSFEGQGDTRRLQIEAKEYNAFIVGPFGEDKKTRIRTTDKGQVILEVVWQPDDAEQQKKLAIEKMPTVRQSVFLDVNDSNGLDMGPFKNADLNKLREVFGLNAPGIKWSFADFIGKPAKIKVEQKANKDDPQNPFTNVTAVKKM